MQGWFGQYLNWFSIFGGTAPTPSDAIPLPQAQKTISLDINVIYGYALHVVLAYRRSVSFLWGLNDVKSVKNSLRDFKSIRLPTLKDGQKEAFL